MTIGKRSRQRPRAVRVVWRIILLLALSACGASPDVDGPQIATPGETEAGPTAIPPTETPVPRQELVICADHLPDPLIGSGDPLAQALLRLVMPQAAVFGTGYLATGDLLVALPDAGDGSLRRNDDGTLTVTLRYRDDLTWSDGEPFTAEDALLGLRAAPVPFAPAFEVVAARQVDDLTLEVTAAVGAEYPYVPSQPPLPAHILGEDADAAALSDADLLSAALGPYALASANGETLRFEANSYYPGAEEVIPRVTVRAVPDPAQIAAELAGGGCDMALDGSLPLEQLPALLQSEAAGQVRVYLRAGAVYEQVILNTYAPGGERVPFFADAAVRQAVALAFDRAALPEALWGIVLPVMDSWLPADHWAYAGGGLAQYPYDPAAAAALLDQAGWRDEDGDGIREYHGAGGIYQCERGAWSIAEGTPLTPTLAIPEGDALRAAIAERLVSDLAAVGIAVRVGTVAPEMLFSRDGPLVLRQFDMALLAAAVRPDPGGVSRWVGADVYRHPLTGALVHRWELEERFLTLEQLVERLAYSNIPVPENNFTGQNYGGWCSAGADLAIVEAAQALSVEEKQAAYARHQAIFAAELPVVPLAARPLLAVGAPYVCGIAPGPYDPLTWNIAAWWFDESGTCAR
jgi:peptide/nickel transport system substrate-binding protein